MKSRKRARKEVEAALKGGVSIGISQTQERINELEIQLKTLVEATQERAIEQRAGGELLRAIRAVIEISDAAIDHPALASVAVLLENAIRASRADRCFRESEFN